MALNLPFFPPARGEYRDLTPTHTPPPPHRSSFSCGVDHPAFEAEVSVVPLVSPQDYGTAAAPADGGTRTLAGEQVYGTGVGGAYVPIASALAAGNTANIRIKVLWDAVTETGPLASPPESKGASDCVSTSSLPCGKQCTATGQVVQVNGADGKPIAYTCKADDLPSAERLSIMQGRTTAAVNFWSAALQVKRIKYGSPIVISTDILSAFGFSTLSVERQLEISSQAGTDIVVIMTARPSPYVKIAGYALCRQHDQYGRCTVGHCELARRDFLTDAMQARAALPFSPLTPLL